MRYMLYDVGNLVLLSAGLENCLGLVVDFDQTDQNLPIHLILSQNGNLYWLGPRFIVEKIIL